MSSSSLKFLVIFLAILIFFCFVLLLYGFYSKISKTQVLSNEAVINYSLKLNKNEKITDAKVIDKNNLLILISDSDQSSLIIYNFKNNRIISNIGR